ncbi:hypothetical protein UFOVP106_19 [uncultured Caudovirales phage]|uniref:Uncharacterized protein n=1 Tax=uncultured Caudovirales phage TaxID=2100421 RepID=A0A6J5L3M0_9CAUD|nr:hypothetical protein UFOVP106_19 [uncultured Caudovirales phage]
MKIKNWTKFQHFKDRKPPWVKLYRDLLDDIEWHELDPKAAKVLTMLWLIASEDEGNIPSIKQLAFRLRMTEKDTEVCVSKLSHWLEHDDINSISNEYHFDSLETETETETETERETKKEKREIATIVACPTDVDQQIWDDWKQLRKAKKAPVTQTVVDSARKESIKANMPFSEFLSIWCARGSQGLQADWIKPDDRKLSKTGEMNQRVSSGLTRGLIGGTGNVKLLG